MPMLGVHDYITGRESLAEKSLSQAFSTSNVGVSFLMEK